MKKRIETVSIIGLGALGILYGHHLSKRMGPKALRIVADENRIKRYKEDPVYCNGELCNFSFVSPEEKTGPVDLVIFTVKFNGLGKAVQDMRNQVGEDTILISALNGISSEEVISQAYGWDNILYCVAQGMDAIRVGNSLRYDNMGILCIGDKEPGGISEKTRMVEEFFLRMEIPHKVETDMLKRMWGKFMLNTGVNQAVSVCQGTYKDAQKEGETRDTMMAAMREVVEISKKEGIQLEEDFDYWVGVVNGLHPDSKPSMAQDVDAKRPTEVELFSGTAIRLGKKHGLPTPVNQRLYDRIKEMESQF